MNKTKASDSQNDDQIATKQAQLAQEKVKKAPSDQDLSQYDKSKNEASQQLGFWHIVRSVLFAALGVQSNKNREKDFEARNSIFIYIAAGFIFTLLFVLTIMLGVKILLTYL